LGLAFLFGQAKLAIYKTRTNRIENRGGQEIGVLFKAFIKSRITVEFKYYKAMNDIETFKKQWCYNSIFCTVVEEELFF